MNARYFKTNAEFWLNLQNYYDLECERRAGKASEIERQVQPVGRSKHPEKSKPALLRRAQTARTL